MNHTFQWYATAVMSTCCLTLYYNCPSLIAKVCCEVRYFWKTHTCIFLEIKHNLVIKRILFTNNLRFLLIFLEEGTAGLYNNHI